MVRQTLPILRGGLGIFIAVLFSACLSLGSRDDDEQQPDAGKPEPEASAAPEDEASKFSLFGLFSGKKEKDDSTKKPDRPSDPVPRKVPIGTVHLVHDQGGFVLIEVSGMPSVPAQAELMTYSEQGKPTGKLRLSPERKGNFLVADILGGHPQARDRVMLFGMSGADGNFLFGSEMDPDTAEVLE